MNPLLAQFLAEASDLLAQVDEGLLQLERDPADADLVNEVFRAAHTFKGSSGLFDFPELTQLTHAAEDLLDAVRAGRLALDSAMTDDLLATFDLIRGWLGHVTTHERLPPSAASDAAGLITTLRAPLGGPPATAAAAPAAAAAAAPVAPPQWLCHVDDRWREDTGTWLETTSSTMRFVRYTPDPDCFFRGEDPVHLLRQVPSVERLEIVAPDEWPAPEEYDEYACLLSFVLATRAGSGELAYLFRYVPDQVEIVDLSGAALLGRVDPHVAAGPVPGEAAAAPAPAAAADVRPAQGADAPATAEPGEAEPPPAEPATTDPAVAADARVLLEAARASLTAVGSESGTRLTAILNAVASAARALGQSVRLPLESPAAAHGLIDRLLTAPAAQPGSATPQVGSRILKVDQEKVDRLMELVGELNVAKNGLTFLADAAADEYGSRDLSRRIKEQYSGLHRIAEELQAAVMDVRMLPLSVSFSRFPRLVRDLSRRLGKTIELVTDGEDTMADKDVIEALGDPLVHLVRNSLDHGVETPDERVEAGKPPQARLTLAAQADGDAVVVEVSDDGRGVDPARVKRKAFERGLIDEEQITTLPDADAVDLVFLPGFSTADQVSELSGRGVGMDAVRASVEKLGGTVTMRSVLGAGTTTRLRLPLSMAVTQVMVVSVAGQRFGVPVDLVVETVRLAAADVGRVLHQEVVVLRGDVVPLVDLAQVLDMPSEPDPDADRAVLVVTVNDQRVGLVVQQFHREVDVILKPMEGLLADTRQFSGTALLGDGLVLLVLNLKEVLGLAARVA